jgi:F-type H+-transporting ATPase subunit delta
MPNQTLSDRYAKSLLDSAIEGKQLDRVYADVLQLQKIFSSNEELLGVLNSPVILQEEKEKILNAIAADKLSSITNEFTALIVRKGRESYFTEIFESFIRLYKQFNKIYTLRIITAVPISEELQQEVVKKVTEITTMKNIEVITEVRESIIGGLIFEIGDLIVDASIGFDLNKIRQQFQTNEYVYQIR